MNAQTNPRQGPHERPTRRITLVWGQGPDKTIQAYWLNSLSVRREVEPIDNRPAFAS